MLLFSALLLCGCDVQGPAGSSVCSSVAADSSGTGVVVIDSDYHSTNVALLAWNGSVAVPSLVSSGSQTPGLSTALGEDIAAPSEAPAVSGQVVLLDATNGSVTWVDPKTCQVSGQLSVGQNFFADPYDYLELDTHRAYVVRYNESKDGSAVAGINQGGDVLNIDLTARALLDRIDLTRYTPMSPRGARPHPAKMLRWPASGAYVLVLLEGFTADYSDAAEGTLVALDPVTNTAAFAPVTMKGLKNCSAAVRFSDNRIAVSCSGVLNEQRPLAERVAQSGLILLAPTSAASAASKGALQEAFRVSALELGGGQLALDSLAVVDESHVLLGVVGNLASRGELARPDRWVLVNVHTKAATTVASSREPFIFGNVVCNRAGTSTLCFGADAEASGGSIRRFVVSQGEHAEELAPITHFDPFGLPPRKLSLFRLPHNPLSVTVRVSCPY